MDHLLCHFRKEKIYILVLFDKPYCMNCVDSLFVLQLLLILLAVCLVAYGRQALGLGVVVVKAHVELLIKLVDQVLHGLEAHHLGEVLQLRKVLSGDGAQWYGGGGGVGGLLERRVIQLIHVTGPEVLELLVQAHERGLHAFYRKGNIRI